MDIHTHCVTAESSTTRKRLLSEDSEACEADKQASKKPKIENSVKFPLIHNIEKAPKDCSEYISDSEDEENRYKPLEGCVIVILGNFVNINGKELQERLNKLGACFKGTVNEGTTCLIYGDSAQGGGSCKTTPKYQAAIKLKKVIMSEKEAVEMLEDLENQEYDKYIANGEIQPEIRDGSQEPISTTQPPQPLPVAIPPRTHSKILWADKYSPKNLRELVGNEKAVEKLTNWLKNYESVLSGEKKPIQGKNGKLDPQYNTQAKAVLLSGPPGIGKTTAARLISKGFSYQPIELNASDARSRKALLEPMQAINDNKAMSGRRLGHLAKSLIIFDEVDGMSSGDKGGTSAMIDIIKKARVPIICICNDRQSPKIRSLANYCYDIRFQKPNNEAVLNRVLQILLKENIKGNKSAVRKVIEASGNDIRQVLTALELWARTHSELTESEAQASTDISSKDTHVMVNNFEATSKLLNSSGLNIKDRQDLFFIDYELIPLLVHENYLLGFSDSPSSLSKMAQAADSIALGDVIGCKIRKDAEWSLLQNYGQASSIEPGMLTESSVDYPKFPEYLGKFSTQRKNTRLLSELRISIKAGMGDDESIMSEFLPCIYRMILTPLQNGDIESALQSMQDFNISLEMFKEHLIELQPPHAKSAFKEIPSNIKSAFTKLYNSFNKSSSKSSKLAISSPIQQEDSQTSSDEEETGLI